MKLAQYKGKNVVVHSIGGNTYSGIVNLYTPAKDNDINEDAIAIYSAGIWLDESDIKSIEIVES